MMFAVEAPGIWWGDVIMLGMVAFLLVAIQVLAHRREKDRQRAQEELQQVFNELAAAVIDNEELERIAKAWTVLCKYSDRSVSSFYGPDSPQAKQEAALARAFEVERNQAIATLRSKLIKRYGREALEH